MQLIIALLEINFAFEKFHIGCKDFECVLSVVTNSCRDMALVLTLVLDRLPLLLAVPYETSCSDHAVTALCYCIDIRPMVFRIGTSKLCHLQHFSCFIIPKNPRAQGIFDYHMVVVRKMV